MDADIARNAVIVQHLRDPRSAYYQGLCAMLRGATAKEKAVARGQAAVVVPFYLPESDVVALESQFSVAIKPRGAAMRARTTPRVAAMMFCVDETLAEHAGGLGRRVAVIDGDIVTMAVRGLDRRSVERTGATPRLVAGYAMEDMLLRQMASAVGDVINNRAALLLKEVNDGGGDHFCDHVPQEGRKVDALVVNHLRTPVGPKQLAWLSLKRGAPVYGAFPFQVSMLVKDEGELECFPGRYYVDRAADMLTLVPRDDATMSVSTPFSAVCELATNHSIVVAGEEFLLERYMCVTGLLYYTLRHIDADFEAPESLRSYYFSPKDAEVTVLKFPKVRMSPEGVPVGWGRGEVRILTSRFNVVLMRVQCCASKVVRPVEVYNALMDNNNLLINTLDTAVVAQRMDVEDEQDAALAIALHVNFRRHHASGTLRALLGALRVRHAVSEASLVRLAWLAMTSWLSRPDVSEVAEIDDVASAAILDWCGNDFGVSVETVDPWIEIVQTVGLRIESSGQFYGHLPAPCGVRATRFSSRGAVNRSRGVASRLVTAASAGAVVAATVVSGTVSQPVVPLSDLKAELKRKMMREEAAVMEVPCLREYRACAAVTDGVGECPVPDVDPFAAVKADLVVANGGLFERDAVATGYRLAEVDVVKETRGNLAINDAKRVIPNARWVRDPVVDAGVEGMRVPSQAGLLGAAFKRNVGIPNNRDYVDLDKLPDQVVDATIAACFNDGWEKHVEAELNSGMWMPNEADVEDYLHNVEMRKAKAMVNEFFCEGAIKLDRWLLMAKGKVKPSREPGAQRKVDHAQTIMYLESSSTNGLYSSIMRRVKKCIDTCLRREVCLNAQHSDEEHEDWDNSLEPVRRSHPKTYIYASDIRCYDRSQEHPALLAVMAFYKRLGLRQELLDKWITMHGEKKAYNMMFGVIINIVLCGISGNWETLLRNGLVNLMAVVVSCELTRRDIVMLDIKGDDMDAEFSRPVDVERGSLLLGSMFNLSAKFARGNVRYMCKQLRIKLCGRWYHIADPWPKVQSWFTPQWEGDTSTTMHERWVSLSDGLRHYDNGILVTAAAEAAQVFYGIPGCFYGMAKALAVVKKDANVYYRSFKPPRMVQ